MHAIRRELYPFPPAETINDDYVIPLSVLGRGFRAVYEPAAVVFEEAREMTGFGRRIRIVAGNLQQLRHLGQFVWPWQPLPLLFFLSHKVVRLLVPFAMLTALAANLFLMGSPAYRALLRRATAVLRSGRPGSDGAAAAQSAPASVLLLHGEQRGVFRAVPRDDAPQEHGLEMTCPV